ncbi:rhomboid family intramembrane serine protease [Xylanimonas protaetiae]|uniref:rhomboid family intramembrane serine protease n=1 Tax=Xylanimonas protaetiae TaxID=2509457 RepID=UPI00315AA415
MRQASKAARPTTTAVGGRARRGQPTVTYTIIGICVVSFLLQIVTQGAWTSRFLFAPVVGVDQPWRFLTAAFLHSTSFYGHILFNMYALYITGQFLEPVLGRARYIALCLLSAVGASVGVLLLSNPVLTPAGWTWGPAVVGASGMVFGLFGAMVPVLRRLQGNAAQIIGLIAINGVIGFLVPGISWQAHLGGLVVGFALGYGFAHAPRGRQKLYGWLLPTAVGVLLVAAALAKYAGAGWL